MNENFIIQNHRLKKFNFIPENSALIIVDMQEFFLNKQSHAYIPSSNNIISNVNKLIATYRSKNGLIIFTYHAYEKNEEPGIMGIWWNDVLRVEDEMSCVSKQINYNKNDVLIRKNRYSAFYNTNLDKILKENKINSVVICGVMTHLCCETTARDAFMKDYVVYFITDGTATNSEKYHINSINLLADGFALPVNTNYIVNEVE